MMTSRRMSAPAAFVVALTVMAPGGAAADREPAPAEVERDRSPLARVELRAALQSLVHFRNDADFDRSAPLYDASGQTVGAFASILTPAATLHILDTLRIHYELEVGLNYWSKNNPDRQDPLATDVFVMKHRELYGAGEVLDGRLGFKVGYAHFRDPTGLFVSHWIGVAHAWVGFGPRLAGGTGRGHRVGLFVAQVPDQTFEGILVTDNNFRRDIWLLGSTGSFLLWDGAARVEAAVFGLYDTHVVDQTRWVVAPSARVDVDLAGNLTASLGAVLQAGQLLGQATDGGDPLSVSWAASGNVRLELGDWLLRVDALALSPDDAYEGNDRNHAFLYSGKSSSRTLLLTEDETRDWYDNLDERMSAVRGGFFRNRAGLFVGDVSASWHLHRLVRPQLVLGAATVLKPANALGGQLVGVEADLVTHFPIAPWLSARVVLGGLIPGRAGAALINSITVDATDPVFLAEAALTLRY